MYDFNNLTISSFIQSGRVAISKPTILSSIKAASYFAFKFSRESYVLVKF